MNKLYLECYSGISGDMMVAALIDLGADTDVLDRALMSLPVSGFKTRISRVKKAGIDACDFAVELDKEYENNDHDMSYLHGEGYVHTHHSHKDMQHDHKVMEHNKKEMEHVHRGLAEITQIIRKSDISENAKSCAVKIFEILGRAEAKAHGTTLEKVHFHEVGAIDSIVDIVSVAVCLDNLGISEVIIPVLFEGCGMIRCKHGLLPVPVPAVAAIVEENGLKLHITGIEGEFVTPTGAAVCAAIRTSEKLPQQFEIKKTGIGAGKRNYERASILRAMLIEESDVKSDLEKNSDSDVIYKLESNIDDCSGEVLGYCMDKLLAAGAKDVFYTPIFMKKNRPAYQLNVICKEEDIDTLENIVFRETSTIGIRRVRMERSILKREISNIKTAFGEASVKLCYLPEGLRCYPEYSDVVKLCEQNQKPFAEMYRLIEREAYEYLS